MRERSEKKFLRRLVAKQRACHIGLLQDEQSFVHSVEQPDVLSVRRFHCRVQCLDILNSHRKQRIQEKCRRDDAQLHNDLVYAHLLHQKQPPLPEGCQAVTDAQKYGLKATIGVAYDQTHDHGGRDLHLSQVVLL